MPKNQSPTRSRLREIEKQATRAKERADEATKRVRAAQKRVRDLDTLFCRDCDGDLVFAPKDVALRAHAIHSALEKARTWGQFRAMMPRAEYSKVIRASFDDRGERRPRSTKPFQAEQVAGCNQGDYPEWLQQDMHVYLPEALLKRFGKREPSFLNGMAWAIPTENAEAMIAELKKLGFRVVKRQQLKFW